MFQVGKKESNGDKEGKYRVNFIGDKTYQDLPEDKLADFITNYTDYAKIKKKVSQVPRILKLVAFKNPFQN